MKQKKILGVISILFFVIATFVLSGCFKDRKDKGAKKISLEVWGVFDDSDAFHGINKEYKIINPNITQIKYKKLSQNPVEFEKEIIDAFASGKGPDIVFFNSAWLPEHSEKIISLPESEKQLSLFKNSFVDVSYEDFVKDDQIYAMPLYNDTLALYYNKDLLNQSGISSPPKTWSEVRDQTKIITKIDQYGNIERSAIALGRSKDPGAINRSSDILMLMMMQGGSKMNRGDKNFSAINVSNHGTENPGVNALNFYTQFSQASSEVYTWNTKMDYSIDSFRFGRVAMMINYSYWKDRLNKSDPKLNFDVAPVPQLDLDNKVNYGVYWGMAVTRNREIPAEANYTNEERIAAAWDYIKFVTLPPLAGETFDATQHYLEKTNKPAARRDLVEEQKEDVFFEVFANQSLTAKTWKQPDDSAVEEIFVEMIDEVTSGKASSLDALDTASSRFDALIIKDSYLEK
ncbi:MAG: extracellular solute-binding protein [Patescibacteria group bacterium]|nr:extracellular solute-binding protein [Patescibacteria group bacterium]